MFSYIQQQHLIYQCVYHYFFRRKKADAESRSESTSGDEGTPRNTPKPKEPKTPEFVDDSDSDETESAKNTA